MAVDLHPDVVRAIRQISQSKVGRRYDRMARRKYGIAGWRLAAKQTAGEFGGRSTRTGRGVVSSAGARGPGQFIATTRQYMIQKYGIDPWRSDTEAIKALELYDLERKGIAGYNPGMPTYTNYVLGQHLNRSDRRALRGAGGGGPEVGGSFKLRGPAHTDVGLQKYTVPGQSFAPDRQAARRALLLGGDWSMDKLLAYKSQINSLSDVPARQVTGDLVVNRSQGADVRIPTRGGSGGRSRGRIIVSPNANRPGVGLTHELRQAVQHLAGFAGHPITIGTGTNHNRLTVDGNVSDHWDGHAADIPMAGAALTKLGRQALVAFGMPRKQALRTRGGLFNLTYRGHRVQIIFNTNQGGNHYNHLHLGFR